MAYLIYQENSQTKIRSYFSTLLFPHWEGESEIAKGSWTRFKTLKRAKEVAKKVGGKVEKE